MEFPILSPLDTAQFIKGVIIMGNSADDLVLGAVGKFVFWLRFINRYEAIAPSPPCLRSSTVNKASTQTVASYGILWQNLNGKS